ncbi:MAG: arylamine N-acetyltransferase [Ruminococcaceae bacterium]|nr:arylamine N-acetyltransferase [Oscillospiraceae bacterium]
MYEELYERIPDAAAYMERIGLGGVELKNDRESLDRIIYSHLTNVPFENIDCWAMGKCPELGIKKLFDKIVTRRRGGWCFELNSLLNAFLRELGFETYMVAANVMAGREEIHPPAHCVIVCIIEGKKYLCDVGYGGSVPFGALSFSGESRFGFHLEKDGFYIKLINEFSGREEIRFKDIPAAAVELIPMNYYISQLSTSPFRNQIRVNLRLRDGSAGIIEHEFKMRRGEERIEKFIDTKDLPDILEKYFGISEEGLVLREIGD